MNEIYNRYESAQNILQGQLSNKIILNDAVFPHWIDESDLFWYVRETNTGKEFRLVNARDASNTLAFDHVALADALAKISQKEVDAFDLPIADVDMDCSVSVINFSAYQKKWTYSPSSNDCIEVERAFVGATSPDGKKSIFVKDFNIWVRDLNTGSEKALTDDGEEKNCYAGIQFGIWTEAVQAIWSPDSRKILTVRLDTQMVALRPCIHYVPQSGKVYPETSQMALAYPGDEVVESYTLHAIDVVSGEQTSARYPALAFTGFGKGFFSDEKLAWWSDDSQTAYFIDVKRGANSAYVLEFDASSGATRVIFEEKSDTFISTSHGVLELPLFLPLPETNELIWFSERTGWGHLYLYDLCSGKLKNVITQGPWLVRDILHFDCDRRELLIQTAGRDPEISPYYRDVCRVNIDSTALSEVVSGNFEHVVYRENSFQVIIRHELGLDSRSVSGVSRNGEFVVVTKSRVDTAPLSVLLNRDGRELMSVEFSDVSGLPSGWQWPEPVKLRGGDGKTDVYGVVYRPPNFSSEKKYPVIDLSSGMRELSFVPQGSFINGVFWGAGYLSAAAFAALGFIVVAIEGRGTGCRNKEFHDHNYGDVASTSDFSDRISGLEQLAQKYPYIDISRVGITGSDTQAAPVYGLLNHPEFYKVAVAHCFLEPRYSFAALGEKYHGIDPERPSSSRLSDAENKAGALAGKLLLIQGLLDHYTASSTLRLAEYLQQRNKDFDMICLPNGHHDISSYALRRSWDYLVQHLQEVSPPKEFFLTTGIDILVDKLKSAQGTAG